MLFFSIMGAIYNRFGNLLANNVPAVIFTWCNWRGIADMCAGCVTYEIYKHLKDKDLGRTRIVTILSTIVELMAWGIIIFQMLYGRNKADHIVPYMAIIVVLSIFLCNSYLSQVFNNSFSFKLGKLSFPIYLNQLIAIHIVRLILPRGPFMLVSILMVIGLSMASILTDRFVNTVTCKVSTSLKSIFRS